jgi:Mn-dependent DtxR family transcriptional regulator
MKPARLDGADRARRFPKSQRSTESGEDYLVCIFELIEKKGYARVADVAETLLVSEPSACVMIARLAKKGYIRHEKYRGFTLTDSGRAVAREVHARRCILTAFLQSLGLPPGIISQDVHGLEHHLSQQTFERLRLLVQNLGDWRPVLGR